MDRVCSVLLIGVRSNSPGLFEASVIEFESDENLLILKYRPEMTSARWVANQLEEHGELGISRVLTLARNDLIETQETPDEPDDFDWNLDGDVFAFTFGRLKEGYYRIPGRILHLERDVLLSATGLPITRKTFIAQRNVSIFRNLDKVIPGDVEIVIGGEREDSIPADIFAELLSKFPNSTELDRYARARVANIIGEQFDGMRDFRSLYEDYVSKRKSVLQAETLPTPLLIQSEIDKYVLIRDTIATWLKTGTGRSEKEWQAMILTFILLIFPKYVAVLQNVTINDYYSRPGKTGHRFIDIALVDAAGNIDIIEIKRPFDDVLVGKTVYRGNYVPTKELSGTIMQAEKYLFHLSKWGVDGEKHLTQTYKSQLPGGLDIRITNPKALLILGRDCHSDGSPALNAAQSFDLELVKRKYSNMMDILTYDDLLRRLDRMIKSLRWRGSVPITVV